MRCRLYRRDGTLVAEGPCGLRRDGAIEMVTEGMRPEPRKGEGPLLLVEGPRHYEVRVTDVHGVRDEALAGRFQVFHLAPVQHEAGARS